MIISIDDYFRAYAGNPEITDEIRANAAKLLEKVNALLNCAVEEGIVLRINPATGTHVGGDKNGGWRPQACPIGSPNSSHKKGSGIDPYDPGDALDNWINDQCLEDFGLYREHPDSTHGWCHLTDRAPSSGHRTFWP